jgi:hypothetical protein
VWLFLWRKAFFQRWQDRAGDHVCNNSGQTKKEDAIQGCERALSRYVCFEFSIKLNIIFRNFYTFYPVSHPTVCIYDKQVDWTTPEDMRRTDKDRTPIQGIIKCDVLPPRRPYLGVPILPMRINDRLHFSLCKSCSVKFKDGGKRMDDYSCPHTDEERSKSICAIKIYTFNLAFTTTTTHHELAVALDAGYVVKHLHRCYEWPLPCDWDSELFKPYMRTFLKIKYQASGWPKHCLDENLSEAEREQLKRDFVSEVESKYGIELDPAAIKFNPGLRYIAKLALNS